MFKRVVAVVAVSLMVMGLVVPAAFAQIAKTKEGADRIVLTGKVDYIKTLGGYYIKGENPPGEFMIVNKNDKVFDKLMKNKKTIKIEGILKGTEWVTVEKIDGKKYTTENPGKGATGTTK